LKSVRSESAPSCQRGAIAPVCGKSSGRGHSDDEVESVDGVSWVVVSGYLRTNRSEDALLAILDIDMSDALAGVPKNANQDACPRCFVDLEAAYETDILGGAIE
jgi:hypothetical protein